jgi:2,3-bisphosphoglycerate-dependent phosphoglycerate mutase
MTTIYLVRHAQADNQFEDDFARPLTEKGIKDRHLVARFLAGKNIDLVFSSPYKRAIDTIQSFADTQDCPIQIDENLRERVVGRGRDCTMELLRRRQWSDWGFALPEGECLSQVQNRNIASLNTMIDTHGGKNIAVSSHGVAIGTILKYYDHDFSFDDFMRLGPINPFIIRLDLDGPVCENIEFIDVFQNELQEG